MAEDESGESRAHEEYEDMLHNIALNVYKGDYGAFLNNFADVYIHGNKENKEILRTIWKRLVEKYDIINKVELSIMS